MVGRSQFRRHQRPLGLDEPLVERDKEIAMIEWRLEHACECAGGVTFVEAYAGQGKSRLLTIAGNIARDAGMQVLGAQAAELEREFPFGVATQLFEPLWTATGAAERARLLNGQARRAGYLLNDDPLDPERFPGDQRYSLIRALFWLVVNLSGGMGGDLPTVPVAILVDDAQWADLPSLRFLAYLADRLADLPVALIVASRRGESTPDAQALAALRNAAHRAVLRPAPLTEHGIGVVIEAEFPDYDETFWRACMRVTNGNPMLLSELLAQLRADGETPSATTAANLEDRAPEAVLNSVAVRLGAMSRAGGAVAAAIAVLGASAPLRRVARLAELDLREASGGADELAARHLVHPGSTLRFVHPMIASAVRASLSPLGRADAHRRAAMILLEDGAPPDTVAAHLLMASPGSDPAAVDALRRASQNALACGAAGTAVRMLRRASEEQPGPDVQAELLAELGEAEVAAGLPEGVQHLAAAIQATDEATRRARLVVLQAESLYEQGKHRDAANALGSALDQAHGVDDCLAGQLEELYISVASLIPGLQADAFRRGEQLVARIEHEPTASQRKTLAHLALASSLKAERQGTARRLSELAWGDGALLESESADGPAWPLLSAALLFADELELDLEICNAAYIAALERDSASGCAAASYCRSWALYERGSITEAAENATATLDTEPDAWHRYARTAYGALAACHLLRGQLEEAETALSIIDHPDVSDSLHLPFLLDVRAKLRLAQHRPTDALADALAAGRRQRELIDSDSPGAIAWRSTAALAHLALGDKRRAQELASDELEQARHAGITRVAIRDLRVLGLATGGTAGINALRDAVQLGEVHPARLEYIVALLEFGAALRRGNQRAAARGPLRSALELSHRGGATAIEHRAQAELNATGARVRRPMLTGVESLTPSERRVAELAAKGLTTRKVAETLFVTPKTVEFHLRHIYQKLDVGSRAELKRLLGGSAD